jgi:hypothetical protein
MSKDEKKTVSFSYLATRPHSFPWEALGLDRPKVGKPHSYACSVAAQFSQNSQEMIFLAQRPTMRELTRFISKFDRLDDQFPEKANEIYNLFGNPDNFNRFGAILSSPVEIQVLYYLNWCDWYRQWATKHLTALWHQGMIYIPEGAIFTAW